MKKKFLSLLKDGEILSQVPTNLTNDEVIAIDDMLRENEVYMLDYELVITYEIEDD